MYGPATSQLVLERIPLERFLGMRTDDLRNLLGELNTSRARSDSPLNPKMIEALIRVMDRKDYETVSRLGSAAARAWAHRVGIR